MEPFSAAVAAIALTQTCVKITYCLRHFHNWTAGKVQIEIDGLRNEIDSLAKVANSLKDLAHNFDGITVHLPAAERRRTQDLWNGVDKIMKECRTPIQEFSDLITPFVGDDGKKLAGKVDAVKKKWKMELKRDEVESLRVRIVACQNSLQTLLIALSMIHHRGSHVSTKAAVDGVSDQVRELGFQLQTQISLVRSHFTPSKLDYIYQLASPASTLLESVTLNKHFYVPDAVVSFFTGRENLLSELKATFDVSKYANPEYQKRFIIHGLSGSGKTQFCCKFAERYRESFWGIFAVDASSNDTAINSFCTMAKPIGVEPNERAVKNWLSNLQLPWLLLIDNADDADIDIEAYFPAGPRGCVLVTTRNSQLKVHGTVGKRFYSFQKLERSEAQTLLLKAADEQQPWRQEATEAATTIAGELCCLPLALVLAGRAIRRGLCTWISYLNWYRRSCLKLAARSVEQRLADRDVSLTVIGNFEPLFSEMQDSGDRGKIDAAELLQMFSFFHHNNIRLEFLVSLATVKGVETGVKPSGSHKAANWTGQFGWRNIVKTMAMELAEQVLSSPRVAWLFAGPPALPDVLRTEGSPHGLDEDRLRAALSELKRSSLIMGDEDDVFSVHPLVHSWVRQRHGSAARKAIWCEAACVALAQGIVMEEKAFVGGATEYFRPWDLQPHVNHVRERQREIAHELKAKRDQRSKLSYPPVFCSQPYFGRDEAQRLVKFSLVYSLCGNFLEARDLRETVRLFVVRVRGMYHPTSIAITFALAYTYQQLTFFAESVSLQREVVKACEIVFGYEHPRTLKMTDTLALFLFYHGRLKESTQLHTKTLLGFQNLGEAGRKDAFTAMSRLGMTQQKYFRYEESRSLCEKAVIGLTEIDPKDEETLFAKENLAMAYVELGGDLVECAYELMVEVLEERKERLGHEQPYTLLATLNYSRVLLAMRKHSEALDHLIPGLAIAERNLGESHFGTLSGKTLVARIYKDQERYEEAEAMLNDVDKKHEKISQERGGDHIDRIMAMFYQMEIYDKQGRYMKAYQTGTRIVEVVKNIDRTGLGLQHPIMPVLKAKLESLEAKSQLEMVP